MGNKLHLATAFSGIGAVEQALIRLHKDYDIQFACDNGEIIVEDLNADAELDKIRKMKSVKEKREYANGLYSVKKRTNFVEQSYKANYEIVDDNFFYDVRLLDGTDFKGKVDLFVGGSPCQSFSIAGARGGFEDTRGTLFYEYVRLVKEMQPKVFIYENVFGVLNHDKGKTWATMQNVFSELGYKVKWDILDARNYGIPQGRRRLFVVGFLDESKIENFVFPPKKVEPLKFTTQDFLYNNCAEGHFIFNEKGDIELIPGGQKVEKVLSQKLYNYVMSPGTKNFYHENVEIDLPIARAILSTQGNTHRASVNNYVTVTRFEDGTPKTIRALEPRESLRLMGFPDSFKISVSRAQSYKQSGNSIVVDVLMAIVKEILKVL